TLDGVIAPESWPEMTTGLLGRLEAFRDGDPAARQRIDQILLLRRDGTTVWTEVSTTLMLNEHQDCDLVGVTRDISVRKQAEDALAQQAYILDRLDEGVSVADQAGNLIFTNRSLDAMFGYAHSELA
ncbi:MAG TPA: PAS domain S-box protein, partial [Hyphomicrobiaceae bacterium]|nr:PAS domain S-box protein [Hyphomicrobiaceae bacterium]